jgi:hypothetical protein
MVVQSTGPIGLLTVWAALWVSVGASAAGAEQCAPPANPSRKLLPGCAPCSKGTRSRQIGSAEYEQLVEEIVAAVAEAEAQQRAATANAGPGTAAAPAQFQAPAPSGQIAGASNSVGLRGLEIHFPELRFALPTLQLPSLVKFRREPHMQLDSASAPMIAPASAAAAAAPAGYAPQAYAAAPYGYAPATAAPASAAPASAAPATAGCRPRTRVRRVGPAKQRFWSNEEEWEVIQEVPADDCAPEYEAESPSASRAAGHAPARNPAGPLPNFPPGLPAADAEARPMHRNDVVPPGPDEILPRNATSEIQSARAELAAARRQLAEVTKLLAAAGVDVPTASPPAGIAAGATSGRSTALTSNSSSGSRSSATALRTAAEQTAPRNRSAKAATVQRLFQELEAVDDQSAAAPDAVAEEGVEEATDVPASTQSRRRPNPAAAGPVQPAGHVSPSPVRRPAANPSQSPVKTAPAATSLRGGKGAVGPGHALGR